MRFYTIFFFSFLLYSYPGWSQSAPADITEIIKPVKYRLQAIGPSGEVYSTTGRIVKAIALGRPQSLEIAYIYVNYSPTVKLVTDISGETTAVVSFHAMKLSGDVVYKEFDIENYIFPSLVSFRLIQAGTATTAVAAKKVFGYCYFIQCK